MKTPLFSWAALALCAAASDEPRAATCGTVCRQGRCAFADCARPTSCLGGGCTFERCLKPSCAGGGCVFESCINPTCGGLGCVERNCTRLPNARVAELSREARRVIDERERASPTDARERNARARSRPPVRLEPSSSRGAAEGADALDRPSHGSRVVAERARHAGAAQLQDSLARRHREQQQQLADTRAARLEQQRQQQREREREQERAQQQQQRERQRARARAEAVREDARSELAAAAADGRFAAEQTLFMRAFWELVERGGAVEPRQRRRIRR